MAKVYFEPQVLNDLSNDDLLKKFKDLGDKLNKAKTYSFVGKDVMEDMQMIYDYYVAEIDRRIEEDLLDEDEIEEYY